jgi:hypothetical protein
MIYQKNIEPYSKNTVIACGEDVVLVVIALIVKKLG